MNQQSGMALVLVIWVLSLMMIMAGSFALTMRRETTVISATKDNAIVQAMAEVGVTIAQHMLLADNEKRWQVDGKVYQLKYQDAEIRVQIFSEQGKVDINKADEDLLSKIMAVTSLETIEQQALVSAIIDWRDKDDLVHINGAEKQQYEEAGLSYVPTNKDFKLIEELQMVLGMNATVFDEIKPLITVYSELPQVDLALASNQVISAVTGIAVNDEMDLIQQAISTESETVNHKKIKADEVYTVYSQARLFDDLIAGVQVILKRNNNGNKLQAFQLLHWQPIHQGLSLFNDELINE